MSRFLLNTYDALSEIALWLMFVGAAVSGYYFAEVQGAIGFLILAFVLSVFLVAPFMMISDIRKTVARIEAKCSQSSGQASSIPIHMQPTSTRTSASGGSTTTTTSRQSGHIKYYKGYTLTHGDGGKIRVGGQLFEDVLEAENWINEQVKKAQE